MTELKNTTTDLKRRKTWKRIHELKDRAEELIQLEQQKEKRFEKSEGSLRDLRDNIKQTNVHIMGSQKKKRERGREHTSRIMAEKFPNLGKETGMQTQEAQNTK